MRLKSIFNDTQLFYTTKAGLIIFLLFFIAGLLSLTSTTFGENKELPPDKIIRFTGDANWVPFHFLNEYGKPDGFSVDLVNALCKEVNLGCEIKLYQDWAKAQADVTAGLADAVVGFGKTAERERDFDFSEKIAINNAVIAVRKETATINSLEDLHGTSIADVSGTPYFSYFSKDKRFNVIPVHGEADGLKKLVNREVTAFVSNELSIRHTVKYYQIEGIKTVGRPFWETDYVIGVKKGNGQLLEMINAGLSALEGKGAVDRLTTKWFGSEISVRKIPSWVWWTGGAGASIFVLIGLSAFILLMFNKRLREEVKDRTLSLEKSNKELKKEIHEHKRAEEALREKERELTIRNRIAEIFLTVPSDEMYREVLKVVLNAMESPYGTFAYINADGDRIVPSMTRDIWDKCKMPDKGVFFPRDTWGDTLWARCLIEKKSFSSKIGRAHV